MAHLPLRSSSTFWSVTFLCLFEKHPWITPPEGNASVSTSPSPVLELYSGCLWAAGPSSRALLPALSLTLDLIQAPYTASRPQESPVRLSKSLAFPSMTVYFPAPIPQEQPCSLNRCLNHPLPTWQPILRRWSSVWAGTVAGYVAVT